MSDKIDIEVFDEEGGEIVFDGNILSKEQEGEISSFLLTEIESVMEDGDERAEFLENVEIIINRDDEEEAYYLSVDEAYRVFKELKKLFEERFRKEEKDEKYI